MTPEDLVQLPGPRRLIQEVVAEIERGVSVVLVMPDHMVSTDGTAEAVLTRIADLANAVVAPPEPGDGVGLVEHIVNTIGRDRSWDPGLDPWRDLVAWPPMRGLAIVLKSWTTDVRRVLERWRPLLTDSRLPPADRPVLVFAVRRGDLAPEPGRRVVSNPLDGADDSLMRTIWWWGVIDRLDTEVHLFTESHSTWTRSPPPCSPNWPRGTWPSLRT